MYRLILLGVATLMFGVLACAQSPGKPESDTNEKPKAEEADETPKEPELLSNKDFRAAMNALESANDKLTAAIAAKDAEEAEKYLKKFEENATKVALYAKKDEDGNELRKKDDYKKWVKQLAEQAKTLRKHIKAEEWKEATKAQAKAGEACTACHNVYDPAGIGRQW